MVCKQTGSFCLTAEYHEERILVADYLLHASNKNLVYGSASISTKWNASSKFHVCIL